MAQQGFLLIADITGYTMFLTRSELEHAQGILDALFKSIFAEIKAPIILSNLQGDAALTDLPDANLPQRQFPLDAIERIYCSFANTLGAMRLNTTCTCNACRNMNQLDLKFFLHHGTYATQEMAGRTELQGRGGDPPAPADEEFSDGGDRHQGLRAGDGAGGRRHRPAGFLRRRDPPRREPWRVRRDGLLRLRSGPDLCAMARVAPRCGASPTNRWLSNRWNATCRCRRRSRGPMSPTSRRRSAGSTASTA